MSVIKLLAFGLCGLSCLVGTRGQSQSSAVAPSTTVATNGDLKLQLIFYGYPKIGVPQSGTALITERGLADVRDITFTRIGGELSPNGRWVAYDNCSAFRRGIHLAGPDGSNAKLILPLGTDSCVSTRWSPDSAKLSYTGAHNQVIHTYDIATKTATLIPNTERAGWHSWSPAGNEIVFEKRGPSDSRATGRLLFITDLKGNSRQLTFAKDFASCAWEGNWIHTSAPTWSKTNRIAFTQCGALFMISPSGNDLRQLTTYPQTTSSSIYPSAAAYSPRWSPDGHWIFFIGDMPCRIGEGSLLKRISPDDKRVVDIGKLPYCGGPFSIAPLRQ